MSLNKIGIIGNGKMGTDIFHFLLDFDFSLTWICIDENQRNISYNKFVKKISRVYNAGVINEKAYKNRLENTVISDNLNVLSGADLIIEAINEDINQKKNLFDKIDTIVNKGCIFVSNSSSIIPSRICPDSSRKNKFLGLHFFYPVKLKNICEIIKTENTDANTMNLIVEFAKKIGKFNIIENEENGFILNKVFLDFQTEAFNVYTEKRLNFRRIDELIKREIFPVGVFEMFDSIGVDIMYYSICQYIENFSNKGNYAPLLDFMKNLISENRLGVKTKKGFYSYERDKLPNESSHSDNVDYEEEIILRLKIIYLNSVFKLIEKKVLSENEAEYSIEEYMGIERGPIKSAYESGLKNIYRHLVYFYKKTGNEIYKPCTFFDEK